MSDDTTPVEGLRDGDPKAIADELRAAASFAEWAADETLMRRAADPIDTLVKERDELAAVVYGVKNLLAEASRFREADIDTWVNALALKNVLYPAPTDALREHDRVVAERAWDEGVELALNFAKRNPDGVTLRLEKPNPYRKEQENGDPR